MDLGRVSRKPDGGPVHQQTEPLFFPADAGLLAVAEKAALDLKLAPVKTASGERTPRVVTGVIVTGDALVAKAHNALVVRETRKFLLDE